MPHSVMGGYAAPPAASPPALPSCKVTTIKGQNWRPTSGKKKTKQNTKEKGFRQLRCSPLQCYCSNINRKEGPLKSQPAFTSSSTETVPQGYKSGLLGTLQGWFTRLYAKACYSTSGCIPPLCFPQSGAEHFSTLHQNEEFHISPELTATL